MEKYIKIFLAVLIAFMIYYLYESIAKPIRYAKKVEKIEKRIIEKLKDIKKAQLAYKDIKGEFAPDFDQLLNTMKNDSFKLIKLVDDPNDTTGTKRIPVDTIYVSVKDSLFAKNYPIDSLPFVPLKANLKFKMNAGIIEKAGVKVPVFEVVDPDPINKKRPLQVGSMNEGNYSGNWE